MIQATFDALKSRIETAQGMSGKVFNSVRFKDGGGLAYENYVIVNPTVPDEFASDRYLATAVFDSRATFLFDLRAVGTSQGACTKVIERTLGVLLGQRLTIAGRTCDPIMLDTPGKVRPDESVKPFLYYADFAVEVITRPGGS